MRNDEALRQKGLGLDVDTGTFSPDGAGMNDGDIGAYRALVASLDRVLRLSGGRIVKEEPNPKRIRAEDVTW
jgi:putative ABC transport system ATP-binding protein